MNPKDTIYRQEAIEALETVKPVKAENGELYITKTNARMKLEKLPSAQSKQRMRQIGEDTVLFSVPMEDLDTTSRVILESGTWCKIFYSDEHAQPDVTRIEQELHGKTPEEQYEFLYWLLLKFGLAYTDSRLAVIEWLRGEPSS